MSDGAGRVAPLEGLDALKVDGVRIWFEEARRLEPRNNTAALRRIEATGPLAVTVVTEAQRTTEVGDGDGPDVFERTLRFCEEARLEAAIFPILTPYPGTQVRKRLAEEGRITSNDWRDYDMGHVNFIPRGMTAAELQAGHDWLNGAFYSFSSMYRRIFKLHRSVQVFGPMNLGFRSAIRRTDKTAENICD